MDKRCDFVILSQAVRSQLDLSQEDSAREIGVNCATVNRWENGRFLPSRSALRQVEAYCDQMIEAGRLLPPDVIQNGPVGHNPNKYVDILLILEISVTWHEMLWNWLIAAYLLIKLNPNSQQPTATC